MIPEAQAAHRAGALLRRFVASPYLTDEFWSEVGGKCIASRAALRTLFDELDADPKRLGDRGTVLRQQQSASLDDYDHLLEEAHWHKECWRDLSALAETLRREQVAEHDVDARGADEDDKRISTERRDDAAVDAAPRGIAS